MRPPLVIPYLSVGRLRNKAEGFLEANHPSRSLPIPIEQIVERLKIDIVPIANLQEWFDMVGCTSADMKYIYVDQSVADSRESRFRFTLAHEIGHVWLHKEAFTNLREDAPEPGEWRAFIRGIPSAIYSSMEWQANTFAGLVLVPSSCLRRGFDQSVGAIRKMMKSPALKRVPKQQITEIAWEELTTRLAAHFSVSEAVIHRRLEFDKFKPEDL